MATLFVALQCCRCSTMQVKQQRKSGGRWVCAVCNQKQSVRQVHARGPLARDLRKFVQDSNMARAGIASDGDGAWSDAGGSGGGGASSCGSPSRRRTDWSEYLDPVDDRKDKDGSMEEEVVTELPWAKRCRVESSKIKQRFGTKPAIAEREKLPSGGGGGEESGRRTQGSKGRPSTKWSEYLEEEEEGNAEEILRPGDGGGGLLGSDCYFHHDATGQEVAVEEEVHPDFM